MQWFISTHNPGRRFKSFSRNQKKKKPAPVQAFLFWVAISAQAD
jgi:hypothetical protein